MISKRKLKNENTELQMELMRFRKYLSSICCKLKLSPIYTLDMSSWKYNHNDLVLESKILELIKLEEKYNLLCKKLNVSVEDYKEAPKPKYVIKIGKKYDK